MIMSPAYTHRWIQTSDKPSEQTYDPYKTSVLVTTTDTADADQQRRHAKQQLELTRHYPDRGPRRN
jgi:hypothetical protein